MISPPVHDLCRAGKKTHHTQERWNALSEEKDANTTQIEIEDQLLLAHRGGNLMEAIDQACRTPGVEEEDVASELTKLHNGGTIDVVSAFSALTKSGSGFIFFDVRHVFARTLPHIEHDVLSVIRCVNHLVAEAGDDWAAGTIVDYLIDFIAKGASRAKEALNSTKEDSKLSSLLPAALIAGCRLDLDKYLEETLHLMGADNRNTRGQAIFALSRIVWPEGSGPPGSVHEALERARDTETDDELLASIAKTAASLMKHDAEKQERLIDLIDSAITKGDDHAILAAASLLAMVDKHMPDKLVDKLLLQAQRVKAEHKGTIDQIDHAMRRLISLGKSDIAIHTTEWLIEKKDLDPDAIDSTLHDIQRDSDLLNKTVTRWLLNGNAALCRNAAFLVGDGHGANVPAAIDAAEIDAANQTEVTFLARKICGHFFMNPLNAASMLLSLLQIAQDGVTRTEVGKLLLDPILINYPGKAQSFINENKDSCTAEVREVLRQVDVALQKYLGALQSIDEIPELYPSTDQREAYHRHHTREMEESFKEAEKRSVFLSLISKQTLLYGRTSVNYIHDGQGKTHRQEIPLQQHSVEFEIPRMVQLDPLGLEHQLAVFRAERRQP